MAFAIPILGHYCSKHNLAANFVLAIATQYFSASAPPPVLNSFMAQAFSPLTTTYIFKTYLTFTVEFFWYQICTMHSNFYAFCDFKSGMYAKIFWLKGDVVDTLHPSLH